LKKADLPVKILGKGTLNKNLKISAHGASESAKKAIETAKGSLTLLKKA
jgi:large subunit ribosomal protein L15